MKRIKVKSSNIASIGYDNVEATLEIEFNNGRIYQYFDVPESQYNALINASSHGAYLDKNIVKGGFRYKEI